MKPLPAIVAALSVVAGAAFAQEQRRPASAPNLLVVLADQWRGQALGFLGGEKVLTPAIDRLAAQSLVLTEAVSNYPVCSPYRAMLMTGQWPHRNGVLSNCNSRGAVYGYELRRDARCWSDVLRDRGYALGYIGKWHLESPRKPWVKSYNNRAQFAWNEWTPPERRHGFGFWYAYNTFDRHLSPEYWATDTPRNERVKVDQWGPEHEADVAIRFLRNADGRERDPNRPFALVVSMNPPHMPYRLVPKRYVDRYRERSNDDLLGDRPDLLPAGTRWGDYTRSNLRYQYAMMSGVDDQFARILAALDDLDLADDTIVVFTSDHGDCLGLHGEISKNNPYELSMRVPLIVRWPGRIPPRHDDLLMSVPDLYPTLLDSMGLGDDVPDAVQGESFARVFRDGEGARPSSQPYLFVPPGSPALGRRGVRTHRHTLVVERNEDGAETVVLFDRKTDPFELTDVAAQHPDVVARLRRDELEPWLRRTGDPWSSR